MGLFSRGPQNYPVLPNLMKEMGLNEKAKKSSAPSKARPGGSKKGGAKMKPSIPGFSKKAAEAAKNVPDRYKPIYRKLFNQINDIYLKHADELNPKNGPDDNIPGVYNPGLAAKVSLMEQNLIQFVNYTKTQNETMDTLMDKLQSTGDDDRNLYSTKDMMKVPKKLTREIWDKYYDAESDDPEGSIKFLYGEQQLSINQEAVNAGAIGFDKYMVNPSTGSLITEGGEDAIAMKHGKPMFHDKTIFEIEYEREFSPDQVRFNPETVTIEFGSLNADGMPMWNDYEKVLPDYGANPNWLVKVPDNQADMIQQIAKGLQVKNYIQPHPNNKNLKYVPDENKKKIREQVMYNVRQSYFNDGSQGHKKAMLAREQSVNHVLSLMGISEPNQSAVETYKNKISTGEKLNQQDFETLIGNGILGNNGVSNFDGAKIDSWDQIAEEMILKRFQMNYDDVQWTYSASSNTAPIAKMSPGNTLYIDRFNGYAEGKTNNYKSKDGTGAYDYTSDYYQRLIRDFKANNINFGSNWISHDGIDPNLLLGQSGNFSSSGIENVVIDTRTGKPARGTWESGKFRALDAESVEHLKAVPMFTGHFKFNDANAMKGVQTWSQTGGIDKNMANIFLDDLNNPAKGIMVHAPISGTAAQHYSELYSKDEDGNFTTEKNPNNNFYNMFERADFYNKGDGTFYYDDQIKKIDNGSGYMFPYAPGGTANQATPSGLVDSQIENIKEEADEIISPDENNSMTLDWMNDNDNPEEVEVAEVETEDDDDDDDEEELEEDN